ncbi:MAG TPA: IS3 family transposase [Arsenophonus sp.]
MREIQRVYIEHYCVYGAVKIWRQMNREGFAVARCTVECLMKKLKIASVVRGKRNKNSSINPGRFNTFCYARC